MANKPLLLTIAGIIGIGSIGTYEILARLFPDASWVAHDEPSGDASTPTAAAPTEQAASAVETSEATPAPVAASDIGAVISGRIFDLTGGTCDGIIYGFDPMGDDGPLTVDVIDTTKGTRTTWLFSLESGRNPTINFFNASTINVDGEAIEAPADNSKPIRLIDRRSIQIGDDTLQQCQP